MKLATIFLSVALAVFSLIFWSQYQRARKDLQVERTMKIKLADELGNLQERFSKQQTQLAVLEQKETAQERLVEDLTRAEVTARAALDQSREELAEARREAQAAQALSDNQAVRIAELESQGGDLRRDMTVLSDSLEALNQQIQQTQTKLAHATGDREFLLDELKRLQQEKELVLRQFNDMEMLRTQLARLREDAVINRRLNWMRRGIYSRHTLKGAELLAAKAPLSLPPETAEPPHRLEVEFNQEGGARIVPPSGDPASVQP